MLAVGIVPQYFDFGKESLQMEDAHQEGNSR
jgi:hypothetical protein